MAPVGTAPAGTARVAEPATGLAQALFKEARRRRRRRRLTGTAAVLVLSAAAAATATTWPRSHGRATENGRPAATAQNPAAPAAATAVWFDDSGLHAGDIFPGGRVTQRFVAELNADPLPLVQAGQRVYWVDPAGAFVPALGHWSQLVRYLDVSTGRIGAAGPGQTVFLSADGRYLLMSQTATSLTETPVAAGAAQPGAAQPGAAQPGAAQPGAEQSLTLPRGWYLPGGDGLADPVSGAGLDTADGIVVLSAPSLGQSGATLALWNPVSGAVTVIGRARAVIDAYTPPGARYSLLAWLPAECAPRAGCPVEITDTATRAMRTVPSPRPGGFAMGGAFSPDGRRLALFLNPRSGQEAQLALADVATGSVRVAAAPRFPLGIDIAWVRWLPDRRYLIAGPMTGAGYLVDSATLSAKPLVTSAGPGHRPGPSLNYTTAITGGRWPAGPGARPR
jgi:hypothetical protein